MRLWVDAKGLAEIIADLKRERRDYDLTYITVDAVPGENPMFIINLSRRDVKKLTKVTGVEYMKDHYNAKERRDF